MSLKIMDRIGPSSKVLPQKRTNSSPNKRDHFFTEMNHLRTINFQGICLFSGGVRIVFLPFSSFFRGEPLCAFLGFRKILEVFVGPW